MLARTRCCQAAAEHFPFLQVLHAPSGILRLAVLTGFARDTDWNHLLDCSNRAITYLRMGLNAKALADAEEAILLDPEYIKGGSPTLLNSTGIGVCFVSWY